MEHEYLGVTKVEIENALAKLPSEQREEIDGLADTTMLKFIPNLDEEEIPEFVNDSFVEAIIDSVSPIIREVVDEYMSGMKRSYAPFINYRRMILEERAGKCNEESC